MTPLRARFAPSPTGSLHVGSARTALLNWLFVHSQSSGGGAKLLLRIDDTDPERSDPLLEQAVLEDLRWLGLIWDEGPVHQSERSDRHRAALERLETRNRDGARELDGRVIARADGSPLYNLAAAVDDLDDEITHVLRGRDHLSNTELQATIIRALGGEPPVYVHAPLLTFEDGAKISKRDPSDQAELTIAGLRAAGFPPAAICNALALSLADFGTDELMLTLGEMADRFEIDRLHSADSQFDRDKLRWLAGQHIRAMSNDTLAGELSERVDAPLTSAVLEAARTSGATLNECAQVVRDLIDPPPPDPAAVEAAATEEAAAATRMLIELAPMPPDTIDVAEEIFSELKNRLREQDIKLGPALHGLRARLTGRTQGPEMPYVLATLSGDRLARLRDQT